jgi:pSer/pThr/pTyr-binding forkhead associated (FHA) protein
MPRIIVIKGADLGTTFKIERDEQCQIGRRSDNDLPLNDESLSRYHCEVIYDGKKAILKDKGSRHGTTVNDETIRRTIELADGDKIRLGKSVLRFEWTADRKRKHEEKQKLHLEDEEEFDTRAMEYGPTVDADSSSPDIFAPPENEEEDEDYDTDDSSVGKAMVKAGEIPPTERKTLPAPAVSPEAKNKRTLITVAAVAAVSMLVGAAAFLLMEYTHQEEPQGPVPMEQLSDTKVVVNNLRMLLPRPPTYVIDIEVTNASTEKISVKVRDFLAVDTVGIAYRPLQPTSENDFRSVPIDPAATAKGSLNFELRMGAEIQRLIFQSRGYLFLEVD